MWLAFLCASLHPNSGLECLSVSAIVATDTVIPGVIHRCTYLLHVLFLAAFSVARSACPGFLALRMSSPTMGFPENNTAASPTASLISPALPLPPHVTIRLERFDNRVSASGEISLSSSVRSWFSSEVTPEIAPRTRKKHSAPTIPDTFLSISCYFSSTSLGHQSLSLSLSLSPSLPHTAGSSSCVLSDSSAFQLGIHKSLVYALNSIWRNTSPLPFISLTKTPLWASQIRTRAIAPTDRLPPTGIVTPLSTYTTPLNDT
ncbi:hypothetical protein LZ31DRAFT_151615 [Colletotrichum somersetense]|nr:hypothetical protein LZ31DRAFT_151615 [Colletotrichum somersetense]